MLHETISIRDPVALLVDGENFHADHAKGLMDAARALGKPIVRRVYGKADQIRAWDDLGFRMCPTRPGKNSADMLLCVQAMSLALRKAFKIIFIASSDRDFTYLAEELRELGVTVIGVGSPDAALSFQNSCSRFVAMREMRVKAVVPIKTVPPKPTPMDIQIRTILQGANGGMGIAELSIEMRKRHQTLIGETPEKSWRPHLVARPDLFRCDPKGATAKVYLKA